MIQPGGLGAEIFWTAALVGGAAWAVLAARRAELDPRVMYWAALAGLAGGMLGGQLLGVIVYGDGEWWRVWSGGKSWQGGLVLGALAFLGVPLLLRAPVWRYADAAAPGVAFAYALARLGCFLNGCDYGVRFAGFPSVTYGPGGEAWFGHLARGWIQPGALSSLPVFPVQLLHAVVGVLLGLAVLRVRGPSGRRTAALLVGFGVTRFALEWARGDFVPLWAQLSLQQVIAMGVAATGAALLVRGGSATQPAVATG